MALQPATRRLLTEATAAATYRTAAQAAADADARIAAVKAKPSGLASLGADGIVPAAQLPAGAVVFAKTKTAATSRVSTPALADDPDLVLTNVPAGNYVLDGLLRTDAGSTGALRICLGWGAAGYDGGFQIGTSPGLTSTVTATSSNSWQLAGAGAAINPTMNTTTGNISLLTGALYLPAAQSKVSLMWCQAVSSSIATTLNPGSYLRLTKAA